MAPTTLSAIAQQASGGVCNTPTCLALSKTLLANVNLNIDPCSDFFQFTCKDTMRSVQKKCIITDHKCWYTLFRRWMVKDGTRER